MGGNANLITSVAPCDQSRTEKVSLGSLEGFHLRIGFWTCSRTRYTGNSERVPSCAAPHAVIVRGEAKGTKILRVLKVIIKLRTGKC